MPESKENSVTKELEDRLNHFFSDNEKGLDFTKTEDDPRTAFLQELKSLLLSIDWEISDDTITRFTDTASNMGQAFRDDKELRVFLQILEAIAKYIKRHKAKSHPGAMGVLKSAYYALEKTAVEKHITKDEKKQLLLEEVKNFKNFKKQITIWRLRKDPGREGPLSNERFPTPKEKPPLRPLIKEVPVSRERTRGIDKGPTMPSHEAFARALEEIKELIGQEFRSLRAELARWRQTDAQGPS